MRVALINARPDASHNPGGDTVQVVKTRSALEGLGVQAEVLALENLDKLADYDLAHLFNIQMPAAANQAFEKVDKAGMPSVLSPIYWDVFGLWYQQAATERKFWSLVTRLVGRKMAAGAYIRWQEQKVPGTADWQIQRQLMHRAVRVLPNSKTEAEQLQRFFALGSGFAGKVDVVPNGIDLDLYQRLPEPSAWFLEKYGLRDFILQVGTISPVKNQLGLIEALFDLPVPLVIIGHSMAAYQEYVEACKALGAKRGNVVFIDHLPHEELPGIYALAALHVLPSWRETPGLVSLEAAAAGCRIVSTSIGSTRDYFGGLVRYCDPFDLRSIRSAVETALHSPKSHELRLRVLANFTWKCAAEVTLQAYHKAVGKNLPLEI